VTVDGDELADIRTQLTAILVQGATLTQTVAGLRESIERQDAGRADHEARIRALEQRRDDSVELSSHAKDIAALAKDLATVTKTQGDQGDELTELNRIRWMAAGALLFAGTGIGALLSKILG
jgi:predicted  nucleic acid-binding Zn-ribbon protein